MAKWITQDRVNTNWGSTSSNDAWAYQDEGDTIAYQDAGDSLGVNVNLGAGVSTDDS